MSDRLATYIRSTLLPAGFSIIDADLAFKLSCGLWSSPTNVATDFTDKAGIIARYGAGCQVLNASILEREVLILARSMKGLKGRIEATTGLVVSNITEHQPAEAKAASAPKIPAVVEERITRQLRKDYNRQAAGHADEQRRRDALDKAARHAEWKAQRAAEAELSRLAFYAKRRAADG